MAASTDSSRVLTLVFTDLVDSTALKTAKGDQAVGDLISRHRDCVTASARDFGGRIIDWAGDGCFLTFETPSAAVRFALRIQQAHHDQTDLPSVRIGIHMGEVTEKEGPDGVAGPPRIEGLAVDMAARVSGLSLPGQTLLSAPVFDSARQRLSTEDVGSSVSWCAHGSYELKGIEDTVEICEVGVQGHAPLIPPEGSEKAHRAVTPSEEETLGWRPASGHTIPGRAHWVLESQLGVGGFGEVWLAAHETTHAKRVFKFCFQADRVRGLKREVVLFRLLKETLGDRGDIARVLDWDFEKPPYFLEAEYTEGGDLKVWSENEGGIGQVPLATRLTIVAQVAEAIDAAHSAGVLHKDIKPANVLISDVNGTPKACLTDFGIGLLTDPEALKKQGITATGLTQTLAAGSSTTTSGTGMYLAPEIFEGKPPTERSDIYALGVLLYQMIIGDFSHAIASGWERDVNDDLLREDIAMCVDGNPERRLQKAGELANRLNALAQRRAEHAAAETAAADAQDRSLRSVKNRRRLVATAVAAAVIGVVAVLGTLLAQSSTEKSRIDTARIEGIPHLKELIEAGNYEGAFQLGMELAELLPGDPTLEEYLAKASNFVSFATSPQGATVQYKSYADVDQDWTDLGITPIKSVRFSRGHHRIRLSLDGYAPREIAFLVLDMELASGLPGIPGSGKRSLNFELFRPDELLPNVIPVDAGPFIPGLTGFVPRNLLMPSFFIDRTEVTNEAFKEFVDAGGYRDERFWKNAFVQDDRTLSFAEAVTAFTDATGQPGPALWIQGDYPDGGGQLPVRGVSWFEAAAYAEFRGKELPSVYHWTRMAHSAFEILLPLGPSITPLSNFGGEKPAPVASNPGIGSSGAYDVAGNVREWCWNDDGQGNRFALGGAWSDPPYMYTLPQAQSPWDRFDTNGFRCAVYKENARGLPEFFASIDDWAQFDYKTEPLSDEIHRVYKERFSYAPTPLNPIEEHEPEANSDYVEHTVSIAAAYRDERFDIHITLPANGSPPYKASIFVPGINALSAPSYVLMPWEEYAFIPKSGRAIIRPEMAAMYKRGRGNGLRRYTSDAQTGFDLPTQWVMDVSRTIDYLETRDDIDIDDLGLIGFSNGALLAPLFLGVEDRLEFAIMASGGIPLIQRPFKPETNPTTYVPGITKPVLMMNGKYDYVFLYETAQKPLFDHLGTPDEHKRHIVYDAGHAPLPEIDVIRDTLEWLDRYQAIP